MGNKQNKNKNKDYCGLTLFDPNDEIHTKEKDLNLIPSTYINFGLYHSPEALEEIYPKIVIFPIEEQIKYCDAITRRYCLNENYLKKQNFDIPINEIVKNIDATKIGNVACIAYYNGLNSKYWLYYTELIKYLKNDYL